MRIKATIVAYVFSVQYFENATIVAYAGLRVESISQNLWLYCRTIHTSIQDFKTVKILL